MAYNDEDDYLMLSGIQHFKFCKRQWALIHIEQQWAENVRTMEGAYVHEKVDNPFIREKRSDKLFVRSMPIKSQTLGLSGVCDMVEFIACEEGVNIQGLKGKYIAYPVEYKRGRPKKDRSDVLQLTAQAMCLEEMLLCEVSKGAMFYDATKHRLEVELTDELKNEVTKNAEEMHRYYERKHTPKVKTGPHCKQCSLNNICMPEILNKHSVRKYIEGNLEL